jgi:outer membrane beta-barrel protein
MSKFSVLACFLVLLITKNLHAGEKSLYDFLWLDPDKKVYVLQNKIHKKEHSFYGDIGYLSNFTSKFQDTKGVSAKVGYYIHEEWGVELFFNQYMNSANDDLRNIRAVNAVEPFVRRFNSAYGALAIWSPFYGKVNTFNRIYYFDWSFGLGFSRINAESNRKNVANAAIATKFDAETYNALAWKTNLKVYLTERVFLGADWMQQHYSAPGPNARKSNKLRSNQDLIVSIGYSI